MLNDEEETGKNSKEEVSVASLRYSLRRRSKQTPSYRDLENSVIFKDEERDEMDEENKDQSKVIQSKPKSQKKKSKPKTSKSKLQPPKKRKRKTKQEEYEGESELEQSEADLDLFDEKTSNSSESEHETDEINKFSGEESSSSDEVSQKSIERILKSRKKEDGEEEYLVKLKGASYLHLPWIPRSQLLAERGSKQKLINFEKQVQNGEIDEDEPFDPQYLQVDRILAKETFEEDDVVFTQYLVKWQGLPYSEVTWEFSEDIQDDEKIEQFQMWDQPPISTKLRSVKWKKLKESPIYKNENQLREYQLLGLNWLSYCWHQKRNCILADEMGLGKTVQTITFLNYLFQTVNIRGPFLVLAPLSVIPHWKREFEGWTDMNVVIYHGNIESRKIIPKYEWRFQNKKYKDLYKFHVILTTYEMLIQDPTVFSSIKWKCLVVDEAHRLKNQNSKLGLQLRTGSYDHIILLTGTPIQNNVKELWTLMNLIAPEEFNSLHEFLKTFGDVKQTEQVEKLQELIKPFILRRMKSDVEKSLVPKEETIIQVELTTIQKKYYRAIFEKNINMLKSGKGTVPSLLNIALQLRKCCSHPYLISNAIEEELVGSLQESQDIMTRLVECSGKMVLLDKLLPKLKNSGHKVLIFSQMVRILDILEDYLNSKKYRFERLDGNTRSNQRQLSIERFSNEQEIFAFLLSTRAGGLGLNLTAADTVIIFDSDWNPQNDLQAQARCHRIGQRSAVKIYRLVTWNTYEMEMFRRSSLKLGLDQALLSNMGDGLNPSSNSVTNRKDEITSLLKHGAYNLVQGDEEAEKFREEDIDTILERRTTNIIQTDDDVTSNPSNTTFASFISKPELDINIDDPDFWDKMVPTLSIEQTKEIEDFSSRKRIRKKVERWNPSKEDFELSADEDFSSSSDERGGVSSHDESENDDNENQIGSIVQKPFSKAERNRLRKCLVHFGYGRWKKIKEVGKLTKRSLEEVVGFADSLLRRCLSHLKDPEDWNEFIQQIDNTDKNEEDENATKTPTETIVKENDNNTNNNNTNNVSPSSPVKDEKSVPTLNGMEEKKPTPIVGVNFDNDPTLLEGKFNEYLNRNAKIICKSVKTVARLGKLVRNHLDAILSLDTSEMSLTPWWTSKFDITIILGCYKYGFGVYDLIKADFTKEELQNEWPAIAILNKRVKYLIRVIEKNVKLNEKNSSNQQKEQEKMQKLQEKEEEKQKKLKEKQRKKEEKDSEWSKREQHDFYKYLATVGLKYKSNGELDWEDLQTEANLKRKTPQMLKEYYNYLVEQCGLMHLKLDTKPSKQEEMETEATITGYPPQFEPLGDRQSRRIIEALSIFDEVRNKYSLDQELEIKLARIYKKPKSEFPLYWNYKYDKALFIGVSKHGFKWEQIASDPDLIFKHSIEEVRMEKEKHKQLEEENARKMEIEVQSITNPDGTPENEQKKNIFLEFPKERTSIDRIKLLLRNLDHYINGTHNIHSHNNSNNNNNFNNISSLLHEKTNNNNTTENIINEEQMNSHHEVLNNGDDDFEEKLPHMIPHFLPSSSKKRKISPSSSSNPTKKSKKSKSPPIKIQTIKTKSSPIKSPSSSSTSSLLRPPSAAFAKLIDLSASSMPSGPPEVSPTMQTSLLKFFHYQPPLTSIPPPSSMMSYPSPISNFITRSNNKTTTPPPLVFHSNIMNLIHPTNEVINSTPSPSSSLNMNTNSSSPLSLNSNPSLTLHSNSPLNLNSTSPLGLKSSSPLNLTQKIKIPNIAYPVITIEDEIQDDDQNKINK